MHRKTSNQNRLATAAIILLSSKSSTQHTTTQVIDQILPHIFHTYQVRKLVQYQIWNENHVKGKTFKAGEKNSLIQTWDNK